jgi:uncharacterized protein
VNSSRNLLRVNVGFLYNQPIGSNRDIHFEFDQIDLYPDMVLNDFNGVVRLNRTLQGILVQGDFKASIEVECVRCLEQFNQSLRAVFNELYTFKRQAMTETCLILPADGNLDFSPLVWEYFNLEIPIKPLCRLDCKGLCIMCGANLNDETCEHQNQVIKE